MNLSQRMLFDTVLRYLRDDGGDGEAWIVSPRCRALADQFEVYARDKLSLLLIRTTGPSGRIYFHEGQQFVGFALYDDIELHTNACLVATLP